MIYSAKIRVCKNPAIIYKCFISESKSLKTDRSNYTIKKYKDYVEFDIKAKDSIALRATLNSITKLLTVYEKIEKLKEK
jgi:tRNA threonylcarbamoyladenosine modification (KEOPS) complex  Pcc1 subunit